MIKLILIGCLIRLVENLEFLIPDFDTIANTPNVSHINHDAKMLERQNHWLRIMFEKLRWIALRKRLSLNYKTVLKKILEGASQCYVEKQNVKLVLTSF